MTESGIKVVQPEVYLLGRQTVVPDELARFLGDHGVDWSSDSEVPAEILTETAGRVCYMSFATPRPGGNAVYLSHIKEVGHGSVLEHGVWSLLFTGVSRSLTHELVRHRAGMGYSQLSQRYVDESVAEYVEPDVIANDPELHKIWVEAVQHAHGSYVKLAEKLASKISSEAEAKGAQRCPHCGGETMVSGREAERRVFCIDMTCMWRSAILTRTDIRKAARQAARSVLPNATETKIFVTANARALRHFLEQRGSASAEPEIRKLAGIVLDVLQKDSPNLFGDYTRTALPDGTFEINTPYRKV